MSLPKFREWLKIREDSPIGRSKRAFAFGTGVPVPEPELNSRATVNPGLLDLIKGKDSKFDQKSEDELDSKFGDKPKIDKTEFMKSPHKKHHHKKNEDHHPHPQDHQVDQWFKGADELEDALGKLKDAEAHHKPKPPAHDTHPHDDFVPPHPDDAVKQDDDDDDDEDGKSVHLHVHVHHHGDDDKDGDGKPGSSTHHSFPGAKPKKHVPGKVISDDGDEVEDQDDTKHLPSENPFLPKPEDDTVPSDMEDEGKGKKPPVPEKPKDDAKAKPDVKAKTKGGDKPNPFIPRNEK